MKAGKNKVALRRSKSKDTVIIRSAMPAEAAADLVLNTGGTEADSVRAYVECQAPDETVKHLEMVASESVLGKAMVVWDVRTNKNRWWVITNPTYLYSQTHFSSLDYTVSFHVGVQLWNRLATARAALLSAATVEDFQSLGTRCRECLLFLVQNLAEPEMVPDGEEAPTKNSFIGWCKLIANHLAAGSSNERIRSYLADASKSTWRLVNWLPHAQDAGRFEGSLVTDATENVLESFLTALARYEASKQGLKKKRRGRQ